MSAAPLRLLTLAIAPVGLFAGCDELQVAAPPTAEVAANGESDGAGAGAAVASDATDTAADPTLGGDDSDQSDVGLTIGSKAPPLAVEHWFDSELGEEPITSFKRGDVYLVEFWATWCPPCVASMPHLAELQREYADEGVTIVSVSDEPLETVEEFLTGEVQNFQGDEEDTPTYAELTSAYRLTTDPDGSVSADYMEAAGQNGIPTAFLVGKTGQVEWIGHPMEVDSVLARVVADSWDRDAFAREFRERQRMQMLQQEVGMALRQGGPEAAREVVTRFAAQAESANAKRLADQLLGMIEQQVFYSELGQDPQKDVARFAEIVEPISSDLGAINELTWRVYRYAAADRGVGEELLAAATSTAEAALKLDGPKASLLDTIAHLEAERGNLDRAIEMQTRAVNAEESVANPQMQAELQQYLDELKEQANPQAEPADDGEGNGAAPT